MPSLHKRKSEIVLLSELNMNMPLLWNENIPLLSGDKKNIIIIHKQENIT